MDDYSISSLTDSKNEWCARLVSILTFNVIKGINSIFEEAVKLCEQNDEDNKYLMTFQNLLSKIPDWSDTTIETERKRIEYVSGCKYLEDLITCVHIIQLKALTCIRVGLKQQKIDINIPSIDKFIHKTYINTARKLYSNIYLFEKDIYPLQRQKNNRELEILVKEAILNTIRDNIPVEEILKVYMDETEEQEIVSEFIGNEEKIANQDMSNNIVDSKNMKIKEDVKEDVKENLESLANKIYNVTKENEINNDSHKLENENNKLSIDFSDIDKAVDVKGNEEDVVAPKDLETLEKRAIENNLKMTNENEDRNSEENIKLDIGDDLDINMDMINLTEPLVLDDVPILDDIEEL